MPNLFHLTRSSASSVILNISYIAPLDSKCFLVSHLSDIFVCVNIKAITNTVINSSNVDTVRGIRHLSIAVVIISPENFHSIIPVNSDNHTINYC